MRPDDITVHLMIRNEEYFIGYILQSLVQFFPHILVVDTGSNDATISIVKSFPVKLVEKGELDKWGLRDCRNEMMAETKTNWVLQVDGDEYYIAASIQKLLECEMPEGKKVGLTFFYDVGWDGRNFRALPPFNRVAILPSSTKYLGAYPFEEPEAFKRAEGFYYLDDVVGYHLHQLARSSKDEEVYRRMEKRRRFSMMDRKVEFRDILEIPFEGNWPNPYLDYIRRK